MRSIETDSRTTTVPAASTRIWEVDALRGLSIILMVLYHLGYDLTELCGIRSLLGIRVDIFSPVLLVARNAFAALFIILSGISSTLTRSNPRRALKLLGVAIVVTAATYVFLPAETVHFGILHFLGVSILVYGLTLQRAKPAACAAAAAAVFGLSLALRLVLMRTAVPFDWLLPLGVTSPAYSSFDFFPLFPWLGVFLTGVALGKSVYRGRRSLIRRRLPRSFIHTAGRHSLLIYIVHQPVILAVLYVTGLLRY